MDARQLRFFLAVIDFEGFTKAAEQLYIAQPSLSQAIAGLERELGVALFHRVGRGVLPTDAGKQLIGPARQVLRDLATAQSAMDAVKGVASGRVEIITMPSPGVEPLSTIMQQFVKDHPDITLSVDGAFVPEDVLHAVRTGASEIESPATEFTDPASRASDASTTTVPLTRSGMRSVMLMGRELSTTRWVSSGSIPATVARSV